MIRRLGSLLVPIMMLIAAGHAPAGPGPSEHLDGYRQQGIEQADADMGRQLWYASVDERSCTSCHGDTPANLGRHVKTGKPIKPMAPSANPARYQNAKKIEKWFLRNCKWTFGRECSLQERADILTWLVSQ